MTPQNLPRTEEIARRIVIDWLMDCGAFKTLAESMADSHDPERERLMLLVSQALDTERLRAEGLEKEVENLNRCKEVAFSVGLKQEADIEKLQAQVEAGLNKIHSYQSIHAVSECPCCSHSWKVLAETGKVFCTHKGGGLVDPTADKRATCSGCMGKFTPEEWEKHKYVNCD